MAHPTDFWTGRAEFGFHGGMGWMLTPTTVPAFGYAVVDWDALTSMVEAAESEDAVIENHRYRITFDTQKGGITSLFDKQLNYEWVDTSAGHPLHGFVHEEVADHDAPEPRKLLCTVNWSADTATERGWNPDWQANRSAPVKVLLHKTYRLSFATVVEQILEHALIGKIYQRVITARSWRPDRISVRVADGDNDPSRSHIYPVPFQHPQRPGAFRYRRRTRPPAPGPDPGSCRDYFTVQGWVDFNNGEHGMTIATPENPMVQLGDFHFAHNQSEINLERAMLLGWVTNNYWETNFPGAQPGTVTARYHILPYAGDFDESRAHKFSAESEHSRPLVQHLGEPSASQELPATGTLLHMPEPPILVLNLRAEENSIIVTLYNASGESQIATLRGGILSILRAAVYGLSGEEKELLPVVENSISVEILPRMISTIRLYSANIPASTASTIL